MRFDARDPGPWEPLKGQSVKYSSYGLMRLNVDQRAGRVVSKKGRIDSAARIRWGGLKKTTVYTYYTGFLEPATEETP